MNLVESLAAALAAGLSLWEHKEKTKYSDRLIELKRRYYEEFNKPEENRDFAVLDNIEFELRLLTSEFVANVGK